MGRPEQSAIYRTRQYRPSPQGLAGLLGLSFLFLMSGCAQLDRLMGKGTNSVEPTPSVPAHSAIPAEPAESELKPVTKTSDDAQPVNAAIEPLPQPPVAAPARPPTPASDAAKQPETDIKKTEQDKALAEKDRAPKEKKSHAASVRKSKKSAKPKPTTEDAFLPPVPLPSKPAAIGGSGG